MLKLVIPIILIFSLCSCEKVNPVKKWTVQYVVDKKSNTPISYRVTYLTQSGATKTVGPISEFNWESEELTEFESGRNQRIEVETISGKGELHVQIFVNSSIYEEGIKGEFESNFAVESTL